jgi:nucleotide-binding universal stress UspA family protein
MYPTTILLATDGSKESAPAVRTAVELATATGSQLHLVHAISTVPQRPYPRAYEREMRETILHRMRLAALALLDEKVSQVEEMGGTVAGSHYREGQPVEEVLRLSDELGVGLIVTGGRRLARPRLFWSSSFPMELFRHARCPVLIVRGGKAEQPHPTDQR